LKYLVAIPVYNEQRYLPGVLAAVARHAEHILVVNDGSTDATAGLLAAYPHVHTITHSGNRGYGQSVIDAFGFAAARGYDWVITLDCDEQHEPGQIPEFVAEARRDRADVISGSRYLVAHPDDDPPPEQRRRVNRTICEVIGQILGLRLTDSFCGFKAQRVAAMQPLCLDEPGYAFPLQFWVQCVRAGLRVREIPVRRIYFDDERAFGGALDDPAVRLRHYLDVFTRELRRAPLALDARQTHALCRLQRSA
jgi:glycosyltransferase involved in cell wall biosynthesis